MSFQTDTVSSALSAAIPALQICLNVFLASKDTSTKTLYAIKNATLTASLVMIHAQYVTQDICLFRENAFHALVLAFHVLVTLIDAPHAFQVSNLMILLALQDALNIARHAMIPALFVMRVSYFLKEYAKHAHPTAEPAH